VKLQIATPEKIVFEGDCDDLVVRAFKGELNILDRHADLITFVEKGPIVIKNLGQLQKKVWVHEGLLKVEGSNVAILCPKVSDTES